MKPASAFESQSWINKLSYQNAFLSAINNLVVGTLLIQLPNGKNWKQQGSSNNQFSADITIHDERFYKAIMTKGSIGMAEAYRDGWVDSEDMVALLQLAIANKTVLTEVIQGKWYGKFLYRIKHWMNRNNKAGSKKNIHAHYDLGNDFYTLWLDESMTYSSAYFFSDDDALHTAQIQKYQRILEKTNTKEGDTILEVGCGWGGFAEYAALQGRKVIGVSLSKEQLKYAKNRVEQKHLNHLCEFRFQDYRDIPDDNFDAIVSIEMIEAVGAEYWDSYFDCLHKKVKLGGSIVIQAITIDDDQFKNYQNSTDFIQQYIFPGGMLPSPTGIKTHLNKYNLALTSYDTFAKDYAITLAIWQKNFEANLKTVKHLGFDEKFIKIWRFYLEYCQAGFLAKTIDVAHIHATKVG